MNTMLSLLGLVAVAMASGPVQVTDSNYNDVILGGKNAFVKFLAPWWGHCKSMKPAWDSLGSEFEMSSVVIGDADCTVEKALCEKFGVKGYPTIKYFKDGDTEGADYNGGRDLGSLQKFVKDTLVVLCLVDSPEDCNEKEQNYIAKMKGKGHEACVAQLARLDKMKGNSMKADLKAWLGQRLAILKQLVEAGASGKEEL